MADGEHASVPMSLTGATASAVDAQTALAGLWSGAGLPADSLDRIALPSRGPVLPSSFPVSVAAQAALGAAALAAVEIDARRGAPAQRITLDAEHATLDSCGWFRIDGRSIELWDKISGLYPCGQDIGQPGHVRIHANFAHHRDGALKLLGLPGGPATERAAVAQALTRWNAEAFEQAAADAGLVVAAARTFAQWDAHPQGQALAGQPPVTIAPIPGTADHPPRPWPPRSAAGSDARPLAGLRVLDLTRILAGPAAGRTLAAYGAEVLMVNGPHLPNIDNIADMSRGKRSCHVDLRDDAGRQTLRELVRGADVFLQGYRPGGLDARGFGPQALASQHPGIVCVSLSAYGFSGPWAGRRGFDSLVQTASGFNHAEAEAFGAAAPRAMPLQILDYAAGYLLAFGAQAALAHQRERGGSWQVQVSLAGVGHWLRSLGRQAGGLNVQPPPFDPYVEVTDSGFGRLSALRHAAQFSRTPAAYALPAMPPGTHAPAWA